MGWFACSGKRGGGGRGAGAGGSEVVTHTAVRNLGKLPLMPWATGLLPLQPSSATSCGASPALDARTSDACPVLAGATGRTDDRDDRTAHLSAHKGSAGEDKDRILPLDLLRACRLDADHRLTLPVLCCCWLHRCSKQQPPSRSACYRISEVEHDVGPTS